MRVTPHLLAAALFVAAAAAPGLGQAAGEAASAATPEAAAEVEAPVKIFIVLKGGQKVEVEEASERADGVWYRRGNVWASLDRERVARIEREEPVKAAPADGPKEKTERWTLADATRIESFFVEKFGRPLPVSAFGQSGLHTRWGYDHRHSIDVGLHPDSPEGRALRAFLSREGIPFIAFRTAIPGVATAPHIHIGHPSRRLTVR